MTTVSAAGTYAAIMSERILAERSTIAEQWLGRLHQLLAVDTHDIFPTDEILDHIPALIAEIGHYVRAPEEEEIAANAAVIEKARELGVLRHSQKASVHQLVREYETLSDILETFVRGETLRLGLEPTPIECVDVFRRLGLSARTLMRTTVDTFVAEYTTALQERSDRLEKFNRMASHELRTPIATLVFAAALLNNEAVIEDPRRLEQVGRVVQNNAERLAWLIENLQRVARLEEPIETPSQQKVEVAMIAAEVARQLDEMAATRGVSIRIAPGLPAILADPARVELVLLNLVSNAVKYSDPSKPTPFVEISCGNMDEADGSVTIRVRDNGLGIAVADQPAIFDRFYRAHQHLDGKLGISGSGLGLSIVADCVAALGGTIRCESAPGQGASFFISLPTTPASSPAE